MPPPPRTEKNARATGDWTGAALRMLASVQLAIGLLVLLAVVLAVATLVERREGPGYVQWHVYGSNWFAGLLGLLAANIVAAAVVRYPWKPRHAGFLIAHAGILVLMLGAMLTRTGQIEGRMELAKGGDPQDRMVLMDHHELQAHWHNVPGRPARPPATFGFKPGPVDWPEGKTFDLSEKNGVHLRVTGYYCRSGVEQELVADESGRGVPVLKVALTGEDGPGRSGWIAAGEGAEVGDDTIEFHALQTATMLDDFLEPPAADELKTGGVLSMHYDGKSQRIPVEPNVGKKVPLGDGKLSVEIAKYAPDAGPESKRGVVARGPRLDLLIHVDGEKEPLREIAFAAVPFQSFSRMHGRGSPVTFWYHHPDAKAPAGAQVVQTPDGKLYCRVGADGKYLVKGLVRKGDAIDLSDKVRVMIEEHLPSARPEYSYYPVPYADDKRGESQPAVRLEVTAGGTTQEVWLRYGEEETAVQSIDTPEGRLSVYFGDYSYPLGFSLRLLAVDLAYDPGKTTDPVISSTVRLVDKSQEVDEEHTIGMNRPLAHGKFRFYQSGNDKRPFFQITADPGHDLKYLGSAMICAGILFVFFRRIPFGRPAAKDAPKDVREEAYDEVQEEVR